MAYSDFDLADVAVKLGIAVADHADLFAGVSSVPLSPPVEGLLRLYFPLAIANSTEKARSELLIAPVLADAREQLGRRVSLFSGWDFVVDKAKGLNGVCDYILCRSPQPTDCDAGHAHVRTRADRAFPVDIAWARYRIT